MPHKHGHDKHTHPGHNGKAVGRERQDRIGMVKQRSVLATALAFGLLGFVILGILSVVAYMIWA